MHIQLCKVRKKNGAEKKIWAEKKKMGRNDPPIWPKRPNSKIGPKRPRPKRPGRNDSGPKRPRVRNGLGPKRPATSEISQPPISRYRVYLGDNVYVARHISHVFATKRKYICRLSLFYVCQIVFH